MEWEETEWETSERSQEEDDSEPICTIEKTSIPQAVHRVPFVIMTPAATWTPMGVEILRHLTDDLQTKFYARYIDLHQHDHPRTVITVYQGGTPLNDRSASTVRYRRVEGQEGGYSFGVLSRTGGRRSDLRIVEFVRLATFVTIFYRHHKVAEMLGFVDSMMPFDPVREAETVDPDRPY